MNTKLALWIWRICKSVALSVLVMLAIAPVQLYFQMRDDQQYINIGFPYPYFWFSHDNDQLSGAKINGAFIDFSLAFAAVFIFSVVFRTIKKQLSKSRKATGKRL